MRRIESGKILSNHKLAEGVYRMDISLPEISSEVQGPGQFISLTVGEGWQMPLRRPMSIASVENESVSIIYKIFGKGTEWLKDRREGDVIEAIGPLGNRFSLDNINIKETILIGGGVGVAPILYLHEQLSKDVLDHLLIVGAVTAAEQFLEHTPNAGIYLTTDDGTVGEKGTVMTLLEVLVDKLENPYIIACGPEPMLAAIHNYSTEKNIPGQIAVESYMACGTGLCQGCIIQTSKNGSIEHSYHERYSLVCCDGPVYNIDAILI